METLIFMIIWIGGASLHTLYEWNARKCCSGTIFHKVREEKRCVRCRREG